MTARKRNHGGNDCNDGYENDTNRRIES